MFLCCSSFKIFASLMTVSVLSSFLTTTFLADFFFGSYFATKTAQNVPCVIIHGQQYLPRKVAANHQAYLFFWPNINMSWKWQNVTCRFNMFSMVFSPIWNTFGRTYDKQIQFGFYTFLYPLEIHFPSCFSFCVSENGTVSEWVSHNNEERTIKLI